MKWGKVGESRLLPNTVRDAIYAVVERKRRMNELMEATNSLLSRAEFLQKAREIEEWQPGDTDRRIRAMAAAKNGQG